MAPPTASTSIPTRTMENRPLRVLVVVPVYNRRHIVRRTLDSIAGQTRAPDAVVVVDDGSTDGSAREAEAWTSAHRPRFAARVISTANQGASAARNLGVRQSGAVTAAPTDLVAFLDSDDCWPADFLERACQALAAAPAAVAASTDREFVQAQSGAGIQRSSLAGIATNPWLWLLQNDGGIGSCTVLRLPAFHAAGEYPTDLPTGHDVVFFGRVAAHGIWLHLPGAPTRFARTDSVHTGGDAGHLHARYPNHLTYWARAFQQLWQEAPPEVQARRRVAARYLGKRWHRAASSAWRRGALDESSACLREALRFRPYSLKNWLLRMKLLVAKP